MHKNDFDDGEFFWRYVRIYATPTNDPKDWYYELIFENFNGNGILSGEEIGCYYYKQEDRLCISHQNSSINFKVKNFNDIDDILKYLIKGKIYPLFESKKSKIKKERIKKLKNINRKNKND